MKLAVTVLVFCVASLLSLGLVMLYSSSMAEDGSRYVKVQLVWSALGLLACTIMVLLDYRILKRLACCLNRRQRALRDDAIEAPSEARPERALHTGERLTRPSHRGPAEHHHPAHA